MGLQKKKHEFLSFGGCISDAGNRNLSDYFGKWPQNETGCYFWYVLCVCVYACVGGGGEARRKKMEPLRRVEVLTGL
jgi:hypothetical protein